MQAGKLRFRVTIQVKTETRDATGGTVETWSNAETRWADIEPLVGRELWQARQALMQATIKLQMRFYDGLTTEHRIVFGKRIFNIEAVQNVGERNKETVVYVIDSGATTSTTSTTSSSSSTTSTPP